MHNVVSSIHAIYSWIWTYKSNLYSSATFENFHAIRSNIAFLISFICMCEAFNIDCIMSISVSAKKEKVLRVRLHFLVILCTHKYLMQFYRAIILLSSYTYISLRYKMKRCNSVILLFFVCVNILRIFD